MTVSADTSFLVSLYGGDVNTAAARAWMVTHATPILVSNALRFETGNALRLACFRQKITHAELHQALTDMASDFASGILIARDIPSPRLWAECTQLSISHTLTQGVRAFDILHVAAARLLKADTFLSFDVRQRTLAQAAGLVVAP